LTSGENQ